MIPRVLVADAMSERVSEVLGADGKVEVEVRTGLDPEALGEVIGGFDGVVVRSATKITAEILARTERLKVVGRAGIGVDNIDVRAATGRGVVVMNAPTGNSTTTAEHAVAMLMALSRNIPQAAASMRAGRWDKKLFKGRQIAGKTVGVVGLGRIGRLVAQRLKGLGARVLAYDPFITAEAATRLGVEKVDLADLLEASDYITLHTPLTAETHHLIDAAALARTKPGAFLVHCARGGIVDEAALLEALESGRLAGAALDVFEQEPPPPETPLLQHPRVIATPHLGASTVEAQEAVAVEIAEQIRAFLLDGTITNALNTPSVSRDVLEVLAPYLRLGERLGALAAHIHTGPVTAVRVRYQGAPTRLDTGPVTAAVLAALIRHKADPAVNAVSAPAFAEKRGIRVESIDGGEHEDFTNLVTVEIEGGQGTNVQGAVFGRRELRVVGIDRYELDMVPEGPMLLVSNEDQPGVIGAVGTIIAEQGVNVPRLVVGLHEGDQRALEVWSLSAPLASPVLGRLRALPGVRRVVAVDL